MNTTHSTHVSLGSTAQWGVCGIGREDVPDNPYAMAHYMFISNDQMTVTQRLNLSYFLSLESSGGVVWDCML